MSQKATYRTAKGVTLELKPVSEKLVVKVAATCQATENTSDEVKADVFQALVAELVNEGVVKFKLTKEQEALITLVRPELKKAVPSLNMELPDFALHVFTLVRTYEQYTDLALAILEVTSNRKKKNPVPIGPLLPFGRIKFGLAR